MAEERKTRSRKKVSFRWKRSIVVLLSAVMLAVGAVGGSIAYLIDSSGPVENQFEYGTTDIDIEETLEGDTKKDVKITNTGSVPVYVRAMYIVNWKDKDGNIVDVNSDDYDYTMDAPLKPWEKGPGGYYYYPTPVAPDGETESLLTCTVTQCPENPEYHLYVEVLAQSIQSEPEDAVKSAWGFVPGTNN